MQLAVSGLGDEELAVTLVTAVDGDEQYGGAVDGKKGANSVEFGRKNLEDDEGEGELAKSGAYVGALKGPLRGAYLNESMHTRQREDESVSVCNDLNHQQQQNNWKSKVKKEGIERRERKAGPFAR